MFLRQVDRLVVVLERIIRKLRNPELILSFRIYAGEVHVQAEVAGNAVHAMVVGG
jgi:hypothetical protein